MAFSQSDLDLIKDAALNRGLTAPQIAREQSSRGWPVRTVRQWVVKAKAGVEMSVKRKAGGGGKVKNAGLAESLKSRLNADGATISKTVRGLGREEGSYSQVRYALKHKLCLKSVAKVKGSRFSAANVQDRLQCAKSILKQLEDPKSPVKLDNLWFSGDKIPPRSPQRQGARDDGIPVPGSTAKRAVEAEYTT